MQLVTPFQVFAVGTAGGVLLEILHWYNLRKERRAPIFDRAFDVSGLGAVETDDDRWRGRPGIAASIALH